MIQLDIPDPDSHFLLLPCKVCGDRGGYEASAADGKQVYRVVCCGCGRCSPWHSCRHEAQIDWNKRYRETEK